MALEQWVSDDNIKRNDKNTEVLSGSKTLSRKFSRRDIVHVAMWSFPIWRGKIRWKRVYRQGIVTATHMCTYQDSSISSHSSCSEMCAWVDWGENLHNNIYGNGHCECPHLHLLILQLFLVVFMHWVSWVIICIQVYLACSCIFSWNCWMGVLHVFRIPMSLHLIVIMLTTI